MVYAIQVDRFLLVEFMMSENPIIFVFCFFYINCSFIVTKRVDMNDGGVSFSIFWANNVYN